MIAFRKWMMYAANWAADYRDNLRRYPVRPNITPGSLANKLAKSPPETPDTMEDIVADFEAIVPYGMTHWQHPRFFAYFPSNGSDAATVADVLATAMGPIAMLWQTAPIATEMEQVMVDWLRQAFGLDASFTGVLHDGASTATFSAVLTMRERATGYAGNETGLQAQGRLRIYASDQVHSSVDKAVWMAGIGRENLVKVATDRNFSICPEALAEAIATDKAAGYIPSGVVLCVGGTSIGASDRLGEAIAVAKANDLYVHVDAAWAGSAMICPEFRALWDGVNEADSIVINPHKWLGANFECTVQFLADPAPQIQALAARPDYLHTTGVGAVVNYSEWTPQLGRRFRALKLWFMLRAYGLEGLRTMIRNHVSWAKELAGIIGQIPHFELVTPPNLSLFTFAYCPPGQDSDIATQALLEEINNDGHIYLTQTRHQNRYVIRVSVGAFRSTRDDVLEVAAVLKQKTGIT